MFFLILSPKIISAAILSNILLLSRNWFNILNNVPWKIEEFFYVA